MRHRKHEWEGSFGDFGEILERFYLNMFTVFYVNEGGEALYFQNLKDRSGIEAKLEGVY